MSFEIQELPDIIKIIALLSITEESPVNKSLLKRKIDKYCAGHVCVEMKDVEEALKELHDEGLVKYADGSITGLVAILSAPCRFSHTHGCFRGHFKFVGCGDNELFQLSFGRKTEDIADLISIKALMDYSLSDIPDSIEREK